MTPREPGTIVVPLTSGGLHLFGAVNQHHGHLVRVISRSKPVTSAVGWSQDVQCVPCGTIFPDVDGSFLGEIAEYPDLLALREQVLTDCWVSLQNLKLVDKILEENSKKSINSKRKYVRSQGQTRRHSCHWPGCKKQVPPAMWGCAQHWTSLPSTIRYRIWDAYVPGQENGTPSKEYIAAALEAQTWIKMTQYLDGA